MGKLVTCFTGEHASPGKLSFTPGHLKKKKDQLGFPKKTSGRQGGQNTRHVGFHQLCCRGVL